MTYTLAAFTSGGECPATSMEPFWTDMVRSVISASDLVTYTSRESFNMYVWSSLLHSFAL